MKKPPASITSIRGAFQPEPVTQSELAQLEEMQRLAWRAHMGAITCAIEIQRRIAVGAEVEDGRLYFDEDLGLARNRKSERTG